MLKRFKKSLIICGTLFFTTVLAVVAADITQDGVPFKTDTLINTNNNVTNIETNTAVNNGTVGVNTFGKFNVNEGDIVNLNLINNQTKLVNLIYDSNPSRINGIVNSYMNGKIGGNVLFANPNGFVVGSSGVFNVGSLTLITPTQQSMNSFIAEELGAAVVNETQVNKLISFTHKGDEYLLDSAAATPIKLAPSLIEISGKVNSSNGIDLISGGQIDLKESAVLNANVEFKYDETDIMTGFVPKSSVGAPTTTTSAMNNGNEIVIVVRNNGETTDFLNAIVNLEGDIKSNGSVVLAKAETADAAQESVSKITVTDLKTDNIKIIADLADIKGLNADKADIKTYKETVLNGLTADNVIIDAANANISNIQNSSDNGKIEIKTTGDLILNDCKNIKTDIIINAKTANITGLSTTKDAQITTTAKLSLADGDFNTTTVKAGSAAITDLTTKNNAQITTTGTLELKNGNFATTAIKAGSATITDLKTTGNANLTTTSATGTISLDKSQNGESSIGGDLVVDAKNNLTINYDPTIVGKTILKSAGTIEFKPENVTIDNLVIEKGTNNLTYKTLTVTNTADINTSGEIKGKLLDVQGELKNFAIKDANIGTFRAKVVSPNTNLSSSGKFVADTVEILGKLNSIKLNTAEIKTIKVPNDLAGNPVDSTVNATGNVQLGFDVTGNVVVKSSSNIVLDKSTIGGNLDAEAANVLSIEDKNLDIDGVTSLKAKEIKFALKTGPVFKNDLIIKKGTGTVNIADVTVNGAADFNANKITIAKGTINKLTTRTNELNITEKLIVKDVAEFNPLTSNNSNTSNVTIKNADIKTLVTKDITNIKVTEKIDLGNGTINANGDVELNKSTVQGDLTIDSKNIIIKGITEVQGHTKLTAVDNITSTAPNITSKSMEMRANNIYIKKFTITKDGAKIDSKGRTTIDTAYIKGDLVTNTHELVITNTLISQNGSAELRSDSFISINEAVLDELEMNAHDVDIENIEVKNDANILADGDVIINRATIEGEYKSNTESLIIEDKLTAEKDVYMNANTFIEINNADIDGDFYLSGENITIDEISLTGIFNAEVDDLVLNTSDDINLDYISGFSKEYAANVVISSTQTIINALDDDDAPNIYGKNINLSANENIGEADKKLNLNLAENNNIKLSSDGTTNIHTTGAVGNYREIKTDKLNLTTNSYSINIFSAIVKTRGDIRTANKHIVIDNTTWAPDLYSTLQLRSITTTPHYLFVNGTPFIRTQSLNALRHDRNIYVNNTKDATSMQSWVTSSIEAGLKTSNVAEKFYDKTDKNLNKWTVLESYLADIIAEEDLDYVKIIRGEIMTQDGVYSTVNTNRDELGNQRKKWFRKK